MSGEERMGSADRLFVLANHVEAAVWALIGLICVGCALRRTGIVRRRCWQAGAVFVVFGCSDMVEAHTGAWWRPWWLLVWKGLCTLALVALLIDYRRRRQAM